MNRLIPELQRLITWAKAAPEAAPPRIPAGFAARVSALCFNIPPPDLWVIWQKAVWASAWAAVVIIGVGLVLLSSQRPNSHLTYDLSPAYQVVSTDLVP